MSVQDDLAEATRKFVERRRLARMDNFIQSLEDLKAYYEGTATDAQRLRVLARAVDGMLG